MSASPEKHGSARVVRAEVTEAPISVTELADAVHDAAAGAVVTFEGVVRNHDADRGVTGIGYSCHPTAGQIVEQIAGDIAERALWASSTASATWPSGKRRSRSR